MPTSLLTPTVLNPLLLGKDYMILHLEEGSKGNIKSKCVRDIQKKEKKLLDYLKTGKKLFLLFLKLFLTSPFCQLQS